MLELFLKEIFIYENVYAHTCVSNYRGQKGAPDLPDLELQVVISCLMWVLGTEFGFSERVTSALNL